jgi:hypothetical protein
LGKLLATQALEVRGALESCQQGHLILRKRNQERRCTI